MKSSNSFKVLQYFSKQKTLQHKTKHPPTHTNIDNKLRIPNVINNRQVFHLALKTIFFGGYYQQL